jgi:RNA polymerase sigma factor (TIGR02999 family)
LLQAWRDGDGNAPRELFALVYAELRAVAARQLRRRSLRAGGVTSIVHEAYLKLAGHSQLDVKDRGHFFALAAKAMRQILLDQARRRLAGKRGGGRPEEALDEGALAVAARASEFLDLEEALTRLESLEPRLARLVELRYFAGLSVEEAAQAEGRSPRTVKRDWEKARAFLRRELEDMPE